MIYAGQKHITNSYTDKFYLLRRTYMSKFIIITGGVVSSLGKGISGALKAMKIPGLVL